MPPVSPSRRAASDIPRLGSLGWWMALTAVAVVAALYLPTLRFDLYSDDYYLIRPWHEDHLAAVWSGTWLPWANAPVYYRPLAIHTWETLFSLFGLNAAWLHTLPLIVMAGVAWLLGWFIWRCTASRTLALGGVVFYPLHPAIAGAVGPFLTNQTHGLATAYALMALIYWQRCRTRPPLSWLPLIVPIALAAATKETGLMLPVMLVVLHGARARWLQDLAAPPRWALVCACALFATMFGWRWHALGEMGGYHPPWQEMAMNAPRLAYYTIVWPAPFDPSPWMYGMVSVAAFALGLAVLIRSRQSPEARLALTGIVLLTVTGIPLLFTAARERPYLPALGVLLIQLGGLAALSRWATRRRAWRVTAPALAVATVTAVLATRTVIASFGPCHPRELRGVMESEDSLPDLPPEMRAWMRARTAGSDSCRAEDYVPLYRAVATLSWGAYQEAADDPDTVYRWEDDRVVALVTRQADAVTISMRNAAASAARPVTVTITADSRPAGELRLESSGWSDVRIALAPTWRSAIRQMHRIDLIATGSWTGDLLMRPVAIGSASQRRP